MVLLEQKNKIKELNNNIDNDNIKNDTLIEDKENSNENDDVKEINSDKNHSINDDLNSEPNQSNIINNLEYNGEILDINSDYNKIYEIESIYIEKEFNFYDFDDSLLQYRPLEIQNLVKMLMDLKQALLLTSRDQNIEQIINYSKSEDIFLNFKNNEGATICQSNIGNLQNQLMKYDKAIYHLALSLQNNSLKRFLNRSLSEQYDENDALMKQISYFFNKSKNKEKNNKLVEKQNNNSRNDFSQKIIGILINTRFSRLIYAYYKFFKNMKKLKKNKKNYIEGQFMNTHFHTINFYHKTLIQYIYLSYIKNDMVKIGESILDYIEFLIKFKFNSSSEEVEPYLKFQYLGRQEFIGKQNFKKKIFTKIINWFNLFDDYITYVKDNTSLSDDKAIINDSSYIINSENNNEFNSGSTQSIFLFRINIQRNDFLKGKFALCCQNYNDALFYFIRSAKKKSLVIDGLIKKRSLKHIFKIMQKLNKNVITHLR